MAAYRFEELQPLGRVSLRTRHVNWKNVTDNYSDGMHITVAHPGLTRLFGQSYGVEAQTWVDKMSGQLREAPSAQLSERMYQSLLPHVAASRPMNGSACGCTSSYGQTSHSTSTRIKSTSCR